MVDIKPNIQGGMSQSCETLKCVKLVYSQKYKNDRFWKHLNDLSIDGSIYISAFDG